jgi:hypothetical protein
MLPWNRSARCPRDRSRTVGDARGNPEDLLRIKHEHGLKIALD